jgi:hypothetical protein
MPQQDNLALAEIRRSLVRLEESQKQQTEKLDQIKTDTATVTLAAAHGERGSTVGSWN